MKKSEEKKMLMRLILNNAIASMETYPENDELDKKAIKEAKRLLKLNS